MEPRNPVPALFRPEPLEIIILCYSFIVPSLGFGTRAAYTSYALSNGGAQDEGRGGVISC